MDKDLVLCDVESGFDPKPHHVGFMKDKVALGQVLLPVLWFSPVSIIPPIHHQFTTVIFT
jgi:hypothetical protein